MKLRYLSLLVFFYFSNAFAIDPDIKNNFKNILYSKKDETASSKNKLKIVSAESIKKSKRIAAIRQINKVLNWSKENKAIFDSINENQSSSFIALVGDKIVGYVIVKPNQKLLCCLGVLPTYQNMKIGTKLLNEAINNAQNTLNLKELYWRYDAKNERLEKFYTNFLNTLSLPYKVEILKDSFNTKEKKRIYVQLSNLQSMEK